MTMHELGCCPLCGRQMVKGPSVDRHHLVPKTFGGVHAEPLHRVCHTKIHHTISEKELRDVYNTWESLKTHEEIVKFIAWVSKKEPEFVTKHADTTQRKKKRR